MRQAGRIDEAIVAYQKLLGIEPGLSDSWYNLALLLRTAGRFDEALLAYDEEIGRAHV